MIPGIRESFFIREKQDDRMAKEFPSVNAKNGKRGGIGVKTDGLIIENQNAVEGMVKDRANSRSLE